MSYPTVCLIRSNQIQYYEVAGLETGAERCVHKQTLGTMESKRTVGQVIRDRNYQCPIAPATVFFHSMLLYMDHIPNSNHYHPAFLSTCRPIKSF